MFSKINILSIFQSHLSTLVNHRTNKTSIFDILLFFGLPISASILLLYKDILLNKDIINTLVAALSVFAGLLFNLLLLILDARRKTKPEDKNYEKLVKLLGEVYANISYSILIALITIFLSLIPLLFEIEALQEPRYCIYHLLSAPVFFLIINFIETMLMVLKRVHVLLSKEFFD